MVEAPNHSTRLPDPAGFGCPGDGQVEEACPPPRPRAQARNSPLRLVPSGALAALDAGTALESSFRDLTIP